MTSDRKKTILIVVIYVVIGLAATKISLLYRETTGNLIAIRLIRTITKLPEAFRNPLPSFYPTDLLFGAICSGGLWLLVKVKGKNAKKYRKNVEYGSARWGTHKDIEPFIDPNPRDNVILTKTESLTMKGRVKKPKYGRNKNVMVIGGSGSGKTRFFIKPSAPVRAA